MITKRKTALEASKIHEFTGGKAQYENMLDWAAQHWSDERCEEFDGAMGSKNEMSAEFAVKALADEYIQSINQSRKVSMFVAMARECNRAAVNWNRSRYAIGKRDAYMNAARLIDPQNRVTPRRHR